MKKRTGILFAMVILIGIPFAAKASETSGPDDRVIRSHGTIIYEDDNGSVRIYAEDIALLQEKLASIPDEIFDPILYSHTHVWEYIDITEESHTRHCSICGSKYDVVDMHNEVAANPCNISFDGQEYPGYEKVCECGYKWKEEILHTLVYTQKDEACHTVSCALDGTAYCEGMETSDEPHEVTLEPTDGLHHQKVCAACGYTGDIEECIFEIELEEDDVEGGMSAPTVEKNVRKYCECGNYITEPKADASNLDTGGVETSDTEMNINGKQQSESEKREEETEIPAPIEPPKISVSGNSIENEEPDMKSTEVIIKKEGDANL